MAAVGDAAAVVAGVVLDAAVTGPVAGLATTEAGAIIAAVIEPVEQCCVADPARAPVGEVAYALVAVTTGHVLHRGLHRGKSVLAWMG